MQIAAGLIIVAMIVFAIVSAAREIQQYNRYLKGEIQYLVSRQRRNRRIVISGVLLLIAVWLSLGLFVFHFTSPFTALLFWLGPLFLTALTVYLSVLDFRETSRDLDRIFRDSASVIAKKVLEQRHAESPKE